MLNIPIDFKTCGSEHTNICFDEFNFDENERLLLQVGKS